MDASSISLNRSTFEERLKNLNLLKNIYGAFAIELVFALKCSTFLLLHECGKGLLD